MAVTKEQKAGAFVATEILEGEAPSGELVGTLKVLEGPNRGAAIALVRTFATVGRHPTNDLVLHDARVSSVHLELTRRSAGRVLMRDVGSTNGTWFGSQRIVEVELSPGAVLRIGDSVLELEAEPRAQAAAPAKETSFEHLVGGAAVMRELFAVLKRIAAKPLSLLVQGETGTGKEEVARAVHTRSLRSKGPFAVLDATTIPAALAESVLFGHERGAFTGAESRHQGAFERAHGGTLFLDEIGELPISLQPKLLRVLERRELTRVGGNQSIPIDVRVVAATHRDLRLEIEAGRFREDLYFRLAQVRVVLPPLRARADDVPALVRHFLEQMREPSGEPISIEENALAELAKRPFPGNVRELRNVVVRAAALSEGGTIRVRDIAGEGYGFRGTDAERSALDLSGTFAEAKEHALERFERTYLEALLRRSGGNLSKASREADLARNHLRDLLKKRKLYGGESSGSDGDS
jgi:two-component system nitrogen regulation response regulator GlnG